MIDWICPLIGIVTDISKGGSIIKPGGDRVYFSSGSINQAKRKLRNAGIKYWNDSIIRPGQACITVPEGQGQYAAEVIRQ